MIFFDFETTNKSRGSALDYENSLVCVAWAVDDGPVAVARCHDGRLPADFMAALDANPVRCAHHAKFEMLWLMRAGETRRGSKQVAPAGAWHDTMLAERVMLGNLDDGVSLGAIAERRGFSVKDPLIDSLMKAGVCPSEMPFDRLAARCVRDVRVMRDIFRQQREELEAAGKMHLYRVRCDFAAFLARAEWAGMLLDRDRTEQTYMEFVQLERELKLKLDEITGGINLRSPDQMAQYLYGTLGFAELKDRNGKPQRNKPSKQFPDGRPKTDKHTIGVLSERAETDEQREFVTLHAAYKKASSALSKVLTFFLQVVLEHHGVFHAQFTQTVAATHRTTSRGIPLVMPDGSLKAVQLQNMAGEFKRLFRAPKGYKIVEIDAAQLEFRVAAYAGNDPQAKEDIADPDFDAHSKSASVMAGITYEVFLERVRAGDPDYIKMRKKAKADTFKPLFGGERGTPQQEKWYQEFKRRYSGVAHAQKCWQAEVESTQALTLPWGMTFYWPGAHVNRRGVLVDRSTGRPLGPQICNYPVQELATAEIVPIAILALVRRCDEAGLDVKFVNTIHDSVVAYVREDQIEAYRAAAELAFTVDVYEYLRYHYEIEFDVPLGMGMVAGDFWGEGKEYVYDDVRNRS